MASIPLSRSVHRPVKTCTECKQVKLRCNSRATFPAPCTRCSTRHLQCSVDASFRRTPARKRVEDMARELEAFKSQNIEEHRTTPSPSTVGLSSNPPECVSSYSGAAMVDDKDLHADTFQLMAFIIDRESVIDCFRLFAGFFYPHFPTINPIISIAAIHSSSPLLFWTIIAIVLSKEIRSGHLTLFNQLEPLYKAQLATEILKAPLPLQSIQALSYLIMWPFPVEKQPHDPSWLYSGIAIHASLNMGLHRFIPLNINSESLRTRVSTWLGCFFSNSSLGMFIGIPPSINRLSDLETVEKYIRQHPFPPEFAYQVMVEHTLAKFTDMLLESSKESMNCSLVRLVETELDCLKTRFPTEWTPRVEVTLLVAKLHLYLMTIIRMQPDSTSREVLLKLGLSASLRIVYICGKSVAYESDYYPNIPIAELQRTIPKHFGRGLALATIFLLRFFALNEQAVAEEREMARNHIAIAHRYFQAGSTTPQDERARVARLFETLSRQQPFDIDNAKLRIDNRMGWSLVDDSIEISKDIREKSAQSTPKEVPVIEEPVLDNQPLNFDADMNELNLLDFQLPSDIWGDTLWGVFDISSAPWQM